MYPSLSGNTAGFFFLVLDPSLFGLISRWPSLFSQLYPSFLTLSYPVSKRDGAGRARLSGIHLQPVDPVDLASSVSTLHFVDPLRACQMLSISALSPTVVCPIEWFFSISRALGWEDQVIYLAASFFPLR